MPTDIGIVDLGIGFPYTSVEQKMHAYDFFRANLKDAQSQQEMEFPVEYIFKGVPDVVEEDTDVVEWVLEKMDVFNIAIVRVGLSTERHSKRSGGTPTGSSRDVGQPQRHHGRLRQIDEAKAEHDVVHVDGVPVGLCAADRHQRPQMYPVYAKCVELGIPMCVNAGVAGPRAELAAEGRRIDDVMYDFPDLVFVTRHGCEPWEELAVKLMLKWPGLHY